MGKIVSKVRQLRLNLQAKEGRRISIQEVADQIGVSRVRLTNIELGNIERIETEELTKLCEFYRVGVDQILEYDPSNKRAPLLAAIPA